MTREQQLQKAKEIAKQSGFTGSSSSRQQQLQRAKQIIAETVPQAPVQSSLQSQPVSQSQEKPGFIKSVARGLVSPLVTAGTRIAQAGTALVTGKETNDRPITTNLPGLGSFTVNPMKTKKQAAGEFAQTASLAIGNPIVSGAVAGAGKALERNAGLGSIFDETAKGAAFGLGSKLVGKGVAKAFQPAAKPLQESAEKSYSKVLGATTKQNKVLSDKVVPGLLGRGEKAVTRTGLLNKAQRGMEQTGEALEAAYEKLPEGTRVNIKPIFDNLQKLKQQYVVKGTTQIGDDAAYKAVENMQRKLLDISNESVSVGSIRSFRQILDKATQRTGKAFGLSDSDSVVAEARKATANAIRSELAKEFPEIGKLNAEFNFWSNVQKVLGSTIQRTKSQNPLGNQIATEGGAILGATLKGTVGNALIGAASLKFLKQAIQSTAWRTTSATTKATLANFLARGDMAKADTLLQKIISANRSQK